MGDLYKFELPVPNHKENDLELRIFDSSLIISGVRHGQNRSAGTGWYIQERDMHCFTQAIRLPADARSMRLHYDLTAGVLTVWLPRG